ncbi:MULTISPECIES: class I SAM-dependent methyltransferase [Rufibacter]|uniref:2-polyprenyl-3-methyl-5-hydroxy-6-metoxy-1, 4-benzoquinol methylase n=1 Tax=Rufibacter quisquiliarum TaxID=1549639 RepID=A0A839GLT6_9BACT|nr:MULTISPECIES: class I SAM-dependent methyltransferase [Rufibacter]MBA9075946.1 2-polyprenyl-3-methyl-5-hydroxy-6-metoxy-1,4-benzoquinol methylase [Rufibacter quisquiliarum]
MSYERLDHCPICSKTDFKNFLVVQDKSVSQESFVIVQCTNCQLKFTNPRPEEGSIGPYYASEAYISHSDTSKGLLNKTYRLVRSMAVKTKVDLVNRLGNKGKILDYGCGVGYFLQACQKQGWEVEGIEPNEQARKQTEEKIGKPLVQGPLQNLAEETFEVITLWHVLEHVHTLNETLKELVRATKKGGHLVIAVPNADSYDAKKYGADWAAYDVPRHLYHFNKASMQKLLKKHKLDLKEVLPMKWDSYYVSILSEKYKHGQTKMLDSFFTGFRSNLHGAKNGNSYSSQIFIAQKK